MQAPAAFERARLARDPRFDGQFFVGVRTTGIYCRPICPANSPKRENIEFYPTAAAASEAGFRPCLRCRPECAPGTPAWHGTSTTVRRGLRLIAAGALDDGNVEQLSDRLGVTSRHLRRLFHRHLGASPLAVAHTQRLHFAKRLIDQTELPLGDIAVAAGYGSVRRFNDAFRKSYGRSPRELRRRGRDQAPDVESAALTIRLHYRRPFSWRHMLDFLRPRASPGVEAADREYYRRSVSVDGESGVIEVSHDANAEALTLGVYGIHTGGLFAVVQQVRELFDLDAPVADIAAVLRGDPVLRPLLKRRPGVRVPGAWDPFELAVRGIVGQQISVKAATTLAGRIVERYGAPLDAKLAGRFAAHGLTHVFPPAAKLRRAHFNDMGLVGARIQTIRSLAAAVDDGALDFDSSADPDAIRSALLDIRGIGDWTAQYIAMRALKHPDAFPSSDLGLLRAFDGPAGRRLTPKALKRRAESWRPWRAYAAILLWSSTPDAGG
ncbi:MAG: AlkA N-terminal domain-containing protein [Woeseiaceae bacterium]|nr:AlkA N-terminal domain-containing protein [Woeseiaceae bacterium]